MSTNLEGNQAGQHPQTLGQTYVVQAGDNLTKIALEQCGDESLVAQIIALNKEMIKDPDKIIEGMELVLPPKSSAAPNKKQKEPIQSAMKIPYQFNNVNVWGHRWVNLLRAIKTSEELAIHRISVLDAIAMWERDHQDQTIEEEPSAEDVGSLDVLDSQTDSDSNQQVVIIEERDGFFSRLRRFFGNMFSAESEGENGDKPSTYIEINTGANGPKVGEDYGEDYEEVTVKPDPVLGEVLTINPEPDPEEPAYYEISTLLFILDSEEFKKVERAQAKILRNLLLSLGRFTDGDLGRLFVQLSPPKWRATREEKSPPSALLRALTRNVANDLEIFTKALHQRDRLPGWNGSMVPSKQAGTLFVADALSTAALKPFQSLLGDKHTNIISYFSKRMHIRQIPYDKQVVLIGLPYASVSFWDDKEAYDEWFSNNPDILDNYSARLPYDYMAIPHEIGHFLYHAGTTQFAEPVYKLFSEIGGGEPHGFKGWYEEIFADVVSCYVAGPLAVLGMQSILVDSFFDELIYDDGHHPVSVIRPFIMSYLLGKLGNYDNAIRLLNENWEHTLRIKGHLPENVSIQDHKFTINSHPNHTDKLPAHLHNIWHNLYRSREKRHPEIVVVEHNHDIEIKLDAVLNSIGPVVDKMVEFVKGLDPEFEPWSGELDAEESLHSLDAKLVDLVEKYDDFEPEIQPVWYEIDEEGRMAWLNSIDQHQAEDLAKSYLHAWGDSGPGGGGGSRGGFG